jgi:hypothetical protein
MWFDRYALQMGRSELAAILVAIPQPHVNLILSVRPRCQIRPKYVVLAMLQPFEFQLVKRFLEGVQRAFL